jgi:hypothetical protein
MSDINCLPQGNCEVPTRAELVCERKKFSYSVMKEKMHSKAVKSGGKRYMVCVDCGRSSHL